jgi:RNA polymerase sigma-70 factor (ECF subfamily)
MLQSVQGTWRFRGPKGLPFQLLPPEDRGKPDLSVAAPKTDAKAGKASVGSGYDREAMADCIEAVAARQDKAAFAVLFDYFAPRLKGYLMKQGASGGQAEEVAQEVMITVWRKAGQFDRRQASVSTWLYTIARNRRIDVLRREKFPDYDPDDPMLLPSEAEQPDEAVAAGERQVKVREALDTLPAEQAELIQLAFFKGWSHSEIAENLDLPLGTVKSRLRLAFRKLKGSLDGSV